MIWQNVRALYVQYEDVSAFLLLPTTINYHRSVFRMERYPALRIAEEVTQTRHNVMLAC